MYNTYRLAVDLKIKQTSIVPTIVQYDSARLEFRIFDGGKAVSLDDFVSAEVIHKRPDGQIILGEGSFELNDRGEQVVRYDYLGSEMNQLGYAHASFSIYHENGNKISIQSFKILIVEDLKNGLAASPEAGKLQTLITSAEDNIQFASDSGNYAKDQGDYAKQVADSNKTRFLSPVNNFSDLATIYPSPTHGDTVRVTGESAVYRFQAGSGWIKTDQYNPTAIDNLTTQLAEKALIEDTAKLTNGMRLGSRIALMSDSIGQAPFYLGNSGGNNPATRMRGETWISTASIASKGLIRVGINAAISGNTTQQMLDRFDADLGGTNAEKWDTLAVCGGVNDGIYTVKQTAANIEQMAKKALLLGKNVVFCTLFPANTHAQRVRIRKINFLVQQLAAKYHAPLVDFHAHFLNPATGSWKVGFNADSLHPNLAGVNEAGKFFATTVTPFMQSAQPFLALDNLDTRVMVTGTTNPNPLWLTDTDANGVPDGYTRSANPGGYGIEFAVNPAFDADAVRCRITAVEAATGPFNVAASFDTTKWTSLEICQVALKVKFTPGVAGATAPKFLMKVEAPGSVEGFAFQQELRATHDGVIVSEPFTVPIGTTNLAHKMEVVGGASEVEFSRPTLINLTRQGMV